MTINISIYQYNFNAKLAPENWEPDTTEGQETGDCGSICLGKNRVLRVSLLLARLQMHVSTE